MCRSPGVYTSLQVSLDNNPVSRVLAVLIGTTLLPVLRFILVSAVEPVCLRDLSSHTEFFFCWILQWITT